MDREDWWDLFWAKAEKATPKSCGKKCPYNEECVSDENELMCGELLRVKYEEYLDEKDC